MKMMRTLFLGVFFLLFALSSPLVQAHSTKGCHTKSGKIEALKNKLNFHRKKCSGKIPTPEPATRFGSPKITHVELTQGPENGGALVSIIGQNFLTESTLIQPPFVSTPYVYFGDVPATNVILVSSTSMIAIAPPGKGTVNVSLEVGGPPGQFTRYTYLGTPFPLPEIHAIEPEFNSALGNYSIRIKGLNFFTLNPLDQSTISGVAVYVGNHPCSSYTVANTVQQAADIPPGIGSVPVQIVTPAGTSVQEVVFTYADPEPPTVTAVVPNGGPSDVDNLQLIEIQGTNLSNIQNIYFGDTPSDGFYIASKKSILLWLPERVAGPVEVRVEGVNGDSIPSAGSTFTYSDSSPLTPVIDAIEPNRVPPEGGRVTIFGHHFLKGSQALVSFGGAGVGLDVEVVSENIIRVTAPRFPPRSVETLVVVSTLGGTSDFFEDFRYNYTPMPVVTHISPDKGSQDGGNTVEITGTYFQSVKQVYFGGVAAVDFRVEADGTIFALSPPGSEEVNIFVSTASGVSRATKTSSYEYTPAPPANAPEIRAVRPNTGPARGGSRIVIQGVNFDREVSVTFGDNDMPAEEVFFNSPQLLTVVTPPGLVEPFGTVVHAKQKGDRSATNLASRFTYHDRTAVQSASVSSVSPDEGAEGESLTIHGSGFLAGVGVVQVFFGVAPAEEITILSDSMMRVVIPRKRSNNTVNVWVTTSAGTTDKSPTAKFTYVAP